MFVVVSYRIRYRAHGLSFEARAMVIGIDLTAFDALRSGVGRER